MCWSACCKPSTTNVMCWSTLTVLGACAILACAVWTLSVSNDVRDNTQCMVDSYHFLVRVPPYPLNETDIAADAMEAVDPDVISRVEDVLEWWVASMVSPGATYFGLLLLAALFSCMALASNSCCGPTMSKLLIFIGYFAAVASIAFFSICAASGVASQHSGASDWWHDNVVAPCDTYTADFTNQLNSANASTRDCLQYAPNPDDCADAVDSLAYAAEQLTQFTRFCGCASQWLDKAEPLAAPGVVGALATFLGLFLSFGLCSTLACCGSFAKAMEEKEPSTTAKMANVMELVSK